MDRDNRSEHNEIECDLAKAIQDLFSGFGLAPPSIEDIFDQPSKGNNTDKQHGETK